jgi:hypothetical protein
MDEGGGRRREPVLLVAPSSSLVVPRRSSSFLVVALKSENAPKTNNKRGTRNPRPSSFSLPSSM